ncbi:hypothetical protein [Rosenbergiella australiborealis]|uniref:hypothetical protein n=1 Tax=Rosenbergiella australiborealis TaxID=1544696 RepID=UPI001F4D7E85|nr:hypothetical protein [Rosenbergiella australiborealis]
MKLSRHNSLFIIPLAILLLVAGIYISEEQNIYYWDYNGYWRYWQNFISQFSHHPLSAINEVRHSIRHDDYNVLPVAATSIFGILPIPSRLSYILSLFTFYFFPATILFSILSGRFLKSDCLVIKFFSYILAATFCAFWAPTLRGYPDICGLLFVIASVLYTTKNNFGLNFSIKSAIILGLLLWAPFLLRRWYAYTIVSLYLSLPLLNIYLFSSGKLTLDKIKKTLSVFFISGITSVIFAIVFQGPLLKRIIETNYSYIYSAYQSSLSYSIENLVNFSGLYIYPLMVISILLIIFMGNKNQRAFILFCLFNLVFSFYLFTRTQSPGIQHIMPFALWQLLVVGQGFMSILSKVKDKTIQWLIVLAFTIFASLIQLHTLFGYDFSPKINSILPVETLPMRVDHYDNYLALEKKISELTSNGDKVAVLSSNDVLNDDMLNTLSHRQLENRIIYTSQVDLRDGINMLALESKYIVVTDPPQIHLKADGQRVITVPANSLLNKQDIGKAFIRLNPSYTLNRNVNAWIYERTRPFTTDELNGFLNKLYQFYPEWRAIYSEGIKAAMISAKVEKGDVWGTFSVDDDGLIYAHPGENTPTQVTWVLNGIKQLKITSISTSCNNNDTIKVKISSPGFPANEVEVAKGKQVFLDALPWLGKLSTLSISKNNSSGCDSINISAIQ